MPTAYGGARSASLMRPSGNASRGRRGRHARPVWREAGRSGPTLDLTVQYGIERYYVPEGEGRAIEADMRERPFAVLVAVGSDGTPQIKALMDGDKVLFEEPLY